MPAYNQIESFPIPEFNKVTQGHSTNGYADKDGLKNSSDALTGMSLAARLYTMKFTTSLLERYPKPAKGENALLASKIHSHKEAILKELDSVRKSEEETYEQLLDRVMKGQEENSSKVRQMTRDLSRSGWEMALRNWRIVKDVLRLSGEVSVRDQEDMLQYGIQVLYEFVIGKDFDPLYGQEESQRNSLLTANDNFYGLAKFALQKAFGKVKGEVRPVEIKHHEVQILQSMGKMAHLIRHTLGREPSGEEIFLLTYLRKKGLKMTPEKIVQVFKKYEDGETDIFGLRIKRNILKKRFRIYRLLIQTGIPVEIDQETKTTIHDGEAGETVVIEEDLHERLQGEDAQDEGLKRVSNEEMLTLLFQLTPEVRGMLAMRFINGYSYAEIASRLRKGENWVNNKINNALLKLKKKMDVKKNEDR